MSDLLPYNATPQERAIGETVARISDVPVRVRDVWNPDTCPSALLPWLAWAFSVDQWDDTWTDAQKRGLIKSNVEIHRRKGTIGAVQDALAALSFNTRVQEWFNQIPPGAPFTFNVLMDVDQIGVTQIAMAPLISVIERTKNLRSHLAAVQLSVRSQAGPYAAVSANVGNEITLANFDWPVTVMSDSTIVV